VQGGVGWDRPPEALDPSPESGEESVQAPSVTGLAVT
jgi:hypothetical protein